MTFEIPEPSGKRDIPALERGIGISLARHIDGASDVQISNCTAPNNGFSNETVLFDATWKGRGKAESGSFVLRSQYGKSILFYDTDLFVQWDVLSALAASSDVPVPTPRWREDDESLVGGPFFVMDNVLGRVPANGPSYHQEGWVADLSPGDRRKFMLNGLSALRKIHSLDRESGFGFLDRDLPGKTPLARYLSWVEVWKRWAEDGRTFPVLDRALDYLRAELPDTDDASLVWGDARVGNMIFGDDLSVAAVLDWEMATLGPAEVDFAWWLVFEDVFTEGFGVQRLEGIPDRHELTEIYEEMLGRSLDQLSYYERFAWVRLILSVLPMEGGTRDPSELLAGLEARMP